MLANTYHLMLRPGAERIARLGGLHALHALGPADPHGLRRLPGHEPGQAQRKITDEGVAFQSHIDGASHLLTPERAIEIQCLLGADIQMQLDECIALPAAREEIERAVDRSLAWAERVQARLRASLRAQAGPGPVRHRPGRHRCRRCAHAPRTRWWRMDFAGYAVGGLAVGETQAAMLDTLELTARRLPARQAALPHGRRHARST